MRIEHDDRQLVGMTLPGVDCQNVELVNQYPIAYMPSVSVMYASQVRESVWKDLSPLHVRWRLRRKHIISEGWKAYICSNGVLWQALNVLSVWVVVDYTITQ